MQLVLVTNKSDRNVEAITQLMICWPVHTLQSFVAWAVEMNLTWNLTGMEHLTLYYDSMGNWGSWHALSVFFPLQAGETSESSM